MKGKIDICAGRVFTVWQRNRRWNDSIGRWNDSIGGVTCLTLSDLSNEPLIALLRSIQYNQVNMVWEERYFLMLSYNSHHIHYYSYFLFIR